MINRSAGEPTRFGKYRVVRKIASGGMAEVYLCRLESDHGFSKKLAVKVVHQDYSRNEVYRNLFVREARLASALSHPNVVSVFDFGREDDRNYLVMEYVEGCSLSSVVSRMHEYSVPIPLPVWRYWMESALSGLGYLHARGIVHRDVSPANILVTRGGAVKISDFGISRKVISAAEGKLPVDGKPGYMAPEILEGHGDDSRSDLFAAAVTGTELLLLKPLYPPGPLVGTRRLWSTFDPNKLEFPAGVADHSLGDVLRKALSLNPENRFPDSDSFIMAIESAIPFRGTRREVECFWDSLYPELEEEITGLNLDFSVEADAHIKRPGILRERGPSYGKGVRRVAVGFAAAVLVAAGTGSFYRYQSNNQERPNPIRGKDLDGRAHMELTIPVKRRPMPVHSSYTDTGVKEIMILEPATVNPGQAVETPIVPVSRPAAGVIPVIQAIPWAKVYDGSRYLGETPIRSIELTVGDHALRFVNEPLGVDRFYSLTVRETGNQNVIVKLMGSRASE